MAAPSGIVWSGIISSNYRLGIYVDVSNSGSTSTATIEAWLWTKWGLQDSYNKYYFDTDATNATTLRLTNIPFNHTVSYGSGWSTSNQTKIASGTPTYTRTTIDQIINCAAKLVNIGSEDATISFTRSYTIPALDSYTVSYDANGGTGAPSSQTKWYDTELKLSTTAPTRTGYAFQGWGTSSSTTTVSYAAGANYTANEAITLYAIWKANTYTVSYNANGGTGAPSSQTKTYGVTLTLSSTKPTRTNYNFKGWGTSASSTTVAYASGASYTSNAAIMLYAVWELAYTSPRVSTLVITRCDSSGTASEDGTYFKISFDWATDKDISSITVNWKGSSDTDWASTTISASGTSGSVSQILGNNAILVDSAYAIRLTIADSQGSSTYTRTLQGKIYPIDFLSGGKGVAIGKAAESEGLEIDLETTVNKQTTFKAFTIMSNTANAIGQLRAHNGQLSFYRTTDNAKDNISCIGYIGYSLSNDDFYVMNSVSGGKNIVNKAWTVSSDRRLKKDITDIPDIFVDVWNELSPKIFRWAKQNSGDAELHFGLIAQDVISVFEKYNLDYRDYGFIGTLKLEEDGPEYFGITYDDYYILTDFVLRKVNSKVNNLQSQIDELKKTIDKIICNEGGN